MTIGYHRNKKSFMTVDNRQTKLRAYRGLGRGRKTCRLQSQLLLVQNRIFSNLFGVQNQVLNGKSCLVA